jgi:homocysteine S-methyltransferase
VIAVGINCTAPAHVAALIRAARAVTDTPIIVYPNAGETYDAITKRWITAASCAPFVDAARVCQEAGASAIGGCCRTTPADIAGLAQAVSGAA